MFYASQSFHYIFFPSLESYWPCYSGPRNWYGILGGDEQVSAVKVRQYSEDQVLITLETSNQNTRVSIKGIRQSIKWGRRSQAPDNPTQLWDESFRSTFIADMKIMALENKRHGLVLVPSAGHVHQGGFSAFPFGLPVLKLANQPPTVTVRPCLRDTKGNY